MRLFLRCGCAPPLSNIGGKKPGFLRIASCCCTAHYLEDVIWESACRNRVSRRTGENRVSGKAFVEAGAGVWCTPLSSLKLKVAETRFLSTDVSDVHPTMHTQTLLFTNTILNP
jgi:hypothetical protein